MYRDVWVRFFEVFRIFLSGFAFLDKGSFWEVKFRDLEGEGIFFRIFV